MPIERAQLLRDLTWVVNSPSLIEESLPTQRLDPNDVDLDHLAQVMSDFQGSRVGRYFERLVLYWIEHVRRLEIVASAMPIRVDGRTKGEIDLLFRDEQGHLAHWELAIKFYLHKPDQTGCTLIGPNARDTFDRKLDRLLNHQLPISKHHVDGVETRRAFVKGRIFYRSENEDCAAPVRALASDHLRGTWIHASEVGMLHDQSTVYQVLPKPLWLAELNSPAPNLAIHSHGELAQLVAKNFRSGDRPILVARLSDLPSAAEKTRPTKMAEIERTFIVADTWPESDHL